MVWHTNDGVADTYNRSVTTGSECVYMLKELLKQAGWSVLMSSDGSTYDAGGDQITSASSGAGGMDNVDAWFRITDPDLEREYIFQRKSQDYSWIMQYSRNAKFVGGTPGITTIPTSSDMVGIAKGFDTTQTMFPTSGTWRSHAMAQDAAYNGVYYFGLFVYDGVSEGTTLYCDPLDVELEGSNGDDDPCVHVGELSAPTFSAMTNQSSPSNFGWMRYGETDQEWNGLTACKIGWGATGCKPNAASAGLGDNPHTNAPVHAQIPYWRYYTSNAVICGYKGKGVYVLWKSDNVKAYTDAIQVGAGDYYFVWKDCAIRGWPVATLPLT